MSRRRERHSESLSRPLPQYRVVLRQPKGPELLTVVRAVMELGHWDHEQATHKMWEWFHNGSTELAVTHFERAEFLADQYARRGLAASVEPIQTNSTHSTD